MKHTKEETLKGISTARRKAVDILESIADYMGNEKMFDCTKGDTTWYDLEDIVTEIIERKEKK